MNKEDGNKNKKNNRLNSVRGTQRFTKPSQTIEIANIHINTESAIRKLKKLAQDYVGVSNPYGFLTNLREALNIPNLKGASKYGIVTIYKNGYKLKASLRITNHNSNAETYIIHEANYEYNLSILVRKKSRQIHSNHTMMSDLTNMCIMARRWRMSKTL